MPRLTRWFVRLSLIYLALALLGWLLAAMEVGPWLGALRPVWLHFFMVGWVTQMIWGVAYWMFPLTRGQRERGPDRAAWGSLLLLNLGLVLRALAEPVSAATGGWALALAAAALLQWAAGVLFVIAIWPRIRGR